MAGSWVKKIRVHSTGIGAETWSVTGDGVLLFNIRLTIHATGRGEYQITSPDRPDVGLWSKLAHEDRFTFDVWNQETVRDILTAIVKPSAKGTELTIEIKHPTR
jgi:hypothetical protein